jgi:hypothetical protein
MRSKLKSFADGQIVVAVHKRSGRLITPFVFSGRLWLAKAVKRRRTAYCTTQLVSSAYELLGAL